MTNTEFFAIVGAGCCFSLIAATVIAGLLMKFDQRVPKDQCLYVTTDGILLNGNSKPSRTVKNVKLHDNIVYEGASLVFPER